MGMKVAVLMGGASFEREFSLASGKNVCAALEEAGHKVVPLDTTADLVPTLRTERPDVCYSALHGKHGEDGTIQSLLEFLDIPFVGSPSHVCHRTWNKDSMHYDWLRTAPLPAMPPSPRGRRASTWRATPSRTWAPPRRSTWCRNA